jgi:DNA-nicking Smr family endonuclease
VAGRRLDPDEDALWRKVTATVRPILRRPPVRPVVVPVADTGVAETPAKPRKPAGRIPPLREKPVVPAKSPPGPGETLDGGWDRRLARGAVAPDITIDLHGHTLASAHFALEEGLSRAVMEDARLMLLVTGRPPREREVDGSIRRGAIRAAVGDWLLGSGYAGRIAAVRNAHPRHGGAGALYIVFRRRRG